MKPNIHVDNRISAGRRAYYAMQGAGLCNNVTDADAIAYLGNAAIRPVLTYGINCRPLYILVRRVFPAWKRFKQSY